MDGRVYSEKALDDFVKSKICQGDSTLLKYYSEGNVQKFQSRLGKIGDQKVLDKVITTLSTDLLRPLTYLIIKRMNKSLKPYGTMIISGGEAFNIYFSKDARIITSDVDTKFIPNIKPRDPKKFGKLQVVRLAIWDTLGKAATYANTRSVAKMNRELSTFKQANMLGLRVNPQSPFRFRYTLIPKCRPCGKTGKPKEGDVLMDVEVFALDLNIKAFSIKKKAVIRSKVGGILDIPIIRAQEFSSEVAHNYTGMIMVPYAKKLERIPVASKRFLVEDLEVMVKFGLRTGDKLIKDKLRMEIFIKDIVGVHNLRPRTSLNTMITLARKRLLKLPDRKCNQTFKVDDWKKFNPQQYQKLIVPVTPKQVTFFLYPLFQDELKNVKNVHAIKFNIRDNQWKNIINIQNVGNRFLKRPNNIEFSISKLRQILKLIIPLMKSDKERLSSVLYGYIPRRDDWMPTGLVNKAAMIGLLGQLKF